MNSGEHSLGRTSAGRRQILAATAFVIRNRSRGKIVPSPAHAYHPNSFAKFWQKHRDKMLYQRARAGRRRDRTG